MPSKRKKQSKNFDFSPMKKKSKGWGNYVEVFETKVSELSIAVITRGDKPEYPWMKPIYERFEMDETGRLHEECKLLTFAPAKGEKDDNGIWQPKKKAQNYDTVT